MSYRRSIRQAWLGLTSRSSAHYWERRYQAGMSSGAGSCGELATYKAGVLNDLVLRHSIQSVIEFGCGDGEQLSLARYPKYLGIDVAKQAIDICIAKFSDDTSKSFLWYDPRRSRNLSGFMHADLTLSLDVIYHLIEDSAYDAHMRDLFGTSSRLVVIYSSDMTGGVTAPHVRHRNFTADVARRMPEFHLRERMSNPHHDQTFAEFFVYEKTRSTD